MSTNKLILILSTILLTGCRPEINKPTEIQSIELAGSGGYWVNTGEGPFFVKKEDIKNYQVGSFYIIRLEKAETE
jgi:hypothetical protein